MNENQRNQYRGKTERKIFTLLSSFLLNFRICLQCHINWGAWGVEINTTKIIELGFGDSTGYIYLSFIHQDVGMINKNCS